MSEAFDRIVDLVASHGKEVLNRGLRRGGSIAGLFAEESFASTASLSVQRGRSTEHRRSRRIAGAGIHLFDAKGSTYASTTDLSAEGLCTAADRAAEAFSSTERASPVELGSLERRGELAFDTLDGASEAEVRAVMQRAADAALSLLPNIAALDVDLQGYSRRFITASSDGRLIRSARSILNLRVRVRGEDGRVVHAVGGGSGGLGLFLVRRPEDIAREAAERFETLADMAAQAPIAGELPVVIGGGWGGVWLHEVVGHALEADVGMYGTDSLGRLLSSAAVTVIDDASHAGGRGSAPVDDEGTTAERTVLIERGVLTRLLTDRATALSLGIPETGNGRRQDYRHAPQPRMTNLTLAPGSAAPDDLLREAGCGLYVSMIGSGRIDPAENAFSIEVTEGYEIEEGRLGRPVSGVRIHGRPAEMLRRIRGIANDFQLDLGRGTCKKGGQVVPVSVGMPTIWLDRMTITPVR